MAESFSLRDMMFCPAFTNPNSSTMKGLTLNGFLSGSGDATYYTKRFDYGISAVLYGTTGDGVAAALTAASNPAGRMLVADSVLSDGSTGFHEATYWIADGRGTIDGVRHNMSVDTTYLDGHVEKVKVTGSNHLSATPGLPSISPAGIGYWSIDIQYPSAYGDKFNDAF